MTSLKLPGAGGIADYTIRNAPLPLAPPPPFNRVAYGAAHIVVDPLADIDPWEAAAIDWDRTVAFREYLWDLGSASPKPWIRRSAAWGSTGPARSS